jgi:RTX calcium-binding nonapeptide repeat (4 copies)
MAYIEGTAGNDNLPGTTGNDTIVGLAGNDVVNSSTLAFGGFDLLFGNAGFDSLYLSVSSNGIAYGGQDNDQLLGSVGQDTMYGDNGADSLQGSASNDLLVGTNVNSDSLNDLADVINGGNGNDVIYGNNGNDLLAGQNGNDTIYGGQGDDFIDGDGIGQFGNDRVFGDLGNDTIIGGSGVDTLTGGSGIQVFAGRLGSGTFEQNTAIITDPKIGDSFAFTEPGASVSSRIVGNDRYIEATFGLLRSRLILQSGASLPLSLYSTQDGGLIATSSSESLSANQKGLKIDFIDPAELDAVYASSRKLDKLLEEAIASMATDPLINGGQPISTGYTLDLPPGTNLTKVFADAVKDAKQGKPLDKRYFPEDIPLSSLEDALKDFVSADISNQLIQQSKSMGVDPFAGEESFLAVKAKSPLGALNYNSPTFLADAEKLGLI